MASVMLGFCDVNLTIISPLGDNDFINPYETIASFSLCKTSIEQMISDSLIGLSETVLISILHVCGFKNEDGVYVLDKVTPASDDDLSRKGMQDVSFNNIKIKEFNKQTIMQIVSLWISKVESDLGSKSKDVFNQVKLISVFYRYVQWGLAIGNDVRQKLAKFIIDYLKDNKISDSDKNYLKKIIKHEREKFESQNWGLKRDPMDVLFGNNAELLELIK